MVDRRIFVGDIVKTPFGIGFVVDARCWREAIVGMSDYEVREFSERCQLEVGIDYIENWVELLVNINCSYRRVLGHQVDVLEGRDESGGIEKNYRRDKTKSKKYKTGKNREEKEKE